MRRAVGVRVIREPCPSPSRHVPSKPYPDALVAGRAFHVLLSAMEMEERWRKLALLVKTWNDISTALVFVSLVSIAA